MLVPARENLVMKLRAFLVCILATALPAIASAQLEARAINAVALRAGPDRDYPFVASYTAGTPLVVQGCTEGYAWCDVLGPNGYRGWVYAGDIGYPYQRRVVPVLGYGPVIGVPVVPFVLGTYWGANYYNRAWYRDRDRWDHYRPPVYRPPAYRPPAYRPPPPRPAPPVAHRPPPRSMPGPPPGPPPGGRPPPPPAAGTLPARPPPRPGPP
jgi:uncharacterized protein YraI